MKLSAQLSPAAVFLALLLVPAPGPAAGAPGDPVFVQGGQAPDSASLRRSAEEAQARFERLRRRRAHPTPAGYRGDCDVTVGRMCLRFDPGDDWWPEPDPPEVGKARDSLLVRLARMAEGIPGDGWISGQRVAYLAEVQRLDAALEVAEACAAQEPGWCDGLRGFVLHRQGRFEDAEKAFRVMLARTDTARAREWVDPAPLLDGAGRKALNGASGLESRSRGAAAWRWADPLFLVPGNDRWTGHLARLVLASVRGDAVNPYHLPWGDDLSEMLIRYGWEYGWERVDPSPAMMTRSTTMRGREHPYIRSYMPPGRALEDPGDSGPDGWNPSGRREPRTGYAPAYAPVLLPARGGLFHFPRGDSLVLVAWLALPEDTTHHAGHQHPPLPEGARWRGRPPVLGLFADPVAGSGGAPRRAATRTGPTRGALRLALPPGRYVLSGEVWAPDSARAGRIRQGLRWEGSPPGAPTLSDLLLLGSRAGEAASTGPSAAGLPATLEEALPLIREGPVRPGDPVAVAWELHGPWPAAGSVDYRLEVGREDGGLLRRAGRFLGVIGDRPAVELSWTEPGNRQPGPVFRTTRLEVPAELEPGTYRLRLRVLLPGREPVERSRRLQLVNPSR